MTQAKFLQKVPENKDDSLKHPKIAFTKKALCREINLNVALHESKPYTLLRNDPLTFPWVSYYQDPPQLDLILPQLRETGGMAVVESVALCWASNPERILVIWSRLGVKSRESLGNTASRKSWALEPSFRILGLKVVFWNLLPPQVHMFLLSQEKQQNFQLSLDSYFGSLEVGTVSSDEVNNDILFLSQIIVFPLQQHLYLFEK